MPGNVQHAVKHAMGSLQMSTMHYAHTVENVG